ncbi:MAG TPA: cupredoxin domain-containing protein [Actinomycetota bacterium]|nr:cupredoxin domain-containing protein [Actinomycetota bacterium]
MSAEARRRAVLGIGIPLGAFVFLALLIFAFSRILLAVPETLAPWVALLFATNILVGCALAATIRGTRGFVFLIAVLVATILGGGIAGAVLGERPIVSHVAEEAAAGEHAAPPAEEAPSEKAPGGEAGAAPGSGQEAPQAGPPGAAEEQAAGGSIEVAARGLAFDTTELSLRAGDEAVIAFDNQDAGIPHNVSIYTEAGGDAVFQGEIITGPDTIEYTFPSPDPGTYYFQCDVHPQMSGSVVVA